MVSFQAGVEWSYAQEGARDLKDILIGGDGIEIHVVDDGNLRVEDSDERVKSFKIDVDISLVELLFQYGRYLFISISRPGTEVANLQGIWNKDTELARELTMKRVVGLYIKFQIYGLKHN
ncbi:Alpha-L-fucosidase 2 [Acorus gramineus]|uniref:Alpha-L-fucosidase 2 n=1 Tax=Acorus gramineus TaxID=55184 RepID=A0AAV8ZWZ8_ACOGR|nr:Alpha-L-fucosidase 2 [Acorus gramineus]